MRACIEPRCPELTMATRCAFHAKTSTRNHGGVSPSRRGYGADYQRQRLALLGQPCALRLYGCTEIADTAQHTDSGELVPACGHCNFADGARRSHETRGDRVDSGLRSAVPLVTRFYTHGGTR